MIADVPTPQDFFDSGVELFDFAWNTVAELITNLSDAEAHWRGSVSNRPVCTCQISLAVES